MITFAELHSLMLLPDSAKCRISWKKSSGNVWHAITREVNNLQSRILSKRWVWQPVHFGSRQIELDKISV